MSPMPTKNLSLFIKRLLFSITLIISIIPSIQAQSPYVTPDDTSYNLDFLLLIGGAIWIIGLAFFAAGQLLKKQNISSK